MRRAVAAALVGVLGCGDDGGGSDGGTMGDSGGATDDGGASTGDDDGGSTDGGASTDGDGGSTDGGDVVDPACGDPCDAGPCALVCYDDRTIVELVVNGDHVYVAAGLDAGGWSVTRVPTAGGADEELASGTGDLVGIGVGNGRIYAGTMDGPTGAIWSVAANGGDRQEIEEMSPRIHDVTADDDGLAWSTDRTVWLLAHDAPVERQVTFMGQEPVDITLFGEQVYFHDRGNGTPDEIVRADRDGQNAQPLSGEGEYEGLDAGENGVFWNDSSQVYWWNASMGAQELFVDDAGHVLAGSVVTDGERVFWIAAGDPGAIHSAAEAGQDATTTYVVANGSAQLDVDDEALYWTVSSTSELRVVRAPK